VCLAWVPSGPSPLPGSGFNKQAAGSLIRSPLAAAPTKALVRTKFGPPEVLRLKDVERPAPADNEVLVEVHASSLNKSDWFNLKPPAPFRLFSGLKPKSEGIGGDFAGRIVAVGASVKQFRPGDEVYGVAKGALAEFALAREDRFAAKPVNLSFAEAAAVPVAGLTALQGLRKGMIRAGQRVLIDGSSGGVGTFAVQVAKSFGAEVTAVCSGNNLETARSLGADHVIDYSQEDFTKEDTRYDLILGVNGYHSVFSYKRALSPAGAYLMVGSHKVISELVQVAILGRVLSRGGGKSLSFMGIAKVTQDDLVRLKELAEAGKIKPFVDRTYSLAEAAGAFRYLGQGHARGKVVVTVDHQN